MSHQCNGGSRCKRPRSLGGYCEVHWVSRQARRHRLPIGLVWWKSYASVLVQTLRLRLDGTVTSMVSSPPKVGREYTEKISKMLRLAEAQIARDNEERNDRSS
jgi:hypothetical protein